MATRPSKRICVILVSPPLLRSNRFTALIGRLAWARLAGLGGGRIIMGLQNLQSLSGVVLTVLICWLLSENRRKFPFRLLGGALLIQVAIVLLLFGLPPARAVLDGVSH